MHLNQSDANHGWDIQAARNLYNIQRWGAKYFDINEAGRVVARPLQEAGASVEINDVIEEAKGRGLKFPLLIRFQDILRHRVESVNMAFRSSIKEFNYQGEYRGVFPIKVNQLREVVEEILDAGKPFNFGLEVGSKPELFAGLAQGHVGPDFSEDMAERILFLDGVVRDAQGQPGTLRRKRQTCEPVQDSLLRRFVLERTEIQHGRPCVLTQHGVATRSRVLLGSPQ